MLLCALAMLAAPPGTAQDTPFVDRNHSSSESMATAADADAPGNFLLPGCHKNSIYFPPGSAELVESALTCIADTAAQLTADTAAQVTVAGYADDYGEAAHGEELRMERAAAVADALLSLGVTHRQISIAATTGDEEPTLSCISEYCRQNYRRAALLFSKRSGR